MAKLIEILLTGALVIFVAYFIKPLFEPIRVTPSQLPLAGPWSPLLCEEIKTSPSRAFQKVAGFESYRAGVSLLVGGCDEKNEAAGRALIHRAIADGLPKAFLPSIVDVLWAQGYEMSDEMVAAAAVEVLTLSKGDFELLGANYLAAPELRAALSRKQQILSSGSAQEIVAEIRVSLGETQRMSGASMAFRRLLLRSLISVNAREAIYWRSVIDRAERRFSTYYRTPNGSLAEALSCMDARAIFDAAKAWSTDGRLRSDLAELLFRAMLHLKHSGVPYPEQYEVIRNDIGLRAEAYETVTSRRRFLEYSEKICTQAKQVQFWVSQPK